MSGYHPGPPTTEGYFLCECESSGSLRGWHFLEFKLIEEEPEKYPGQKMMFVFDQRGGNRFSPQGAYVRDHGQVRGYIPMMELSGPVLAKRLYLNMLRNAWHFDVSWATGNNPRDVELAWCYVQKAVAMAKDASTDPSNLPDDMPREAYKAAIEAIESVKYSKYTKLLGLIVDGSRDPELGGRPALLPFTLTIRMGHDGWDEDDNWKLWDLMFVDGNLEALRERDHSNRVWLDRELVVERSTLADIVKWLKMDPTYRFTARQVLVDGQWRDEVTLEDLEAEVGG